jgi:hypothetical protein
MAVLNRKDKSRQSPPATPHQAKESDNNIALNEFDAELERLAAANQQLLSEFNQSSAEDAAAPPVEGDELEALRLENAELRARVQELEAFGAGQQEELWLERQREYEMLLEEKSEVIRGLHQKMQEMQEVQESAIGGDSAPASSVSCSGNRLGQAEEILRLKREMEEQRRQLEQDEEAMMAQMRQMEMTMAKERAEMARQRQEVQRLKAEITREAENSVRDPELKERLNNLRRSQEPRPASASEHPITKTEQKSSGFFRRIFG